MKNLTSSLLALLMLATHLMPTGAKAGSAPAMRVPARIYGTPYLRGLDDLTKDKALWSAGMKKKMVKEVMANGNPAVWPQGLKSYEEREANAYNMTRLNVYIVASYISNGLDMVLLQIPASENSHMPLELRPVKNIYFLTNRYAVSTDRMYSQTEDGAPLRYFKPSEFFPGKRVHCRITDRGELYSTFNLGNNSTWQQYVKSYETADIEQYSTEDNWPELIQTLSSREKHDSYFKYYNAYAIAKVELSSTTAYIIHIPQYENEHMPEGLAPETDIYMVMGEAGLDLDRGYDEYEDGTPDPLEEEKEEVSGEDGIFNEEVTCGTPLKCYIKDRGELYSTMSIDEYTDQISPCVEDIDYVLEHCNEDGWPEAIQTLQSRNQLSELFKDYDVTAVAKFSDYYLLEVTPEDNAHMPAGMRPTETIYFIIGGAGLSKVKVDKSADFVPPVINGDDVDAPVDVEEPVDAVEPAPAVTGDFYAEITPGSKVKCYIVDRGELYSTFSLDTRREELSKYVKNVDEVIKYANEENWPEGIRTLSGREERDAKFRQYNVNAIAKVDGKYILEATPANNVHMQSDMRPTRTIYFVFGSEGLGTAPR